MNTPIPPPIPPAQTGAPDPTTPGTRPRPTALGQATVAVATGTPLALATVWLLETYGTAHGQPLHFDEYTAAAVGSVGASAIGYLAQVFHGLIGHWQDQLTRP